MGSRQITGVGVSAGVGAGPVAWLVTDVREPGREPVAADAREAEAGRLAPAVHAVAAELDRRGVAAGERGLTEAAEVLDAAAMMTRDPGLLADARRRIVDESRSAPRAVWEAVGVFRDRIAAMGGYLGERASDLDDVRIRLVAELEGRRPPGVPDDPGHPAVLVARDLAPADTATLDPAAVRAIVTVGGGPTSHTAIIACALGIPAVVACAEAADLLEGARVLVDGARGVVTVDPSDDAVRETAARPERRPVPAGGGRLADGTAVRLLANIGDVDGAHAALREGAQGVGLFRTELLFLGRTTTPEHGEQVKAYRAVFDAMAGRRVVVRTLDAGADKPLPFLGLEPEENPALGVRGWRIADGGRREVVEGQLRALAEAADGSDAEVWVMAPMISTPDEAAEFARTARAAGLAQVGVMIEVPGAALLADRVLAEVDFASLGTNDLGQYTMAADRGSAALATLTSPWQPALLRLVRAVAQAGERAGRPVGVCGEAAGDPAIAVVLAGLGITSLSMTPPRLGAVAAVLAGVDLPLARELADRALEAPGADQARAAVTAGLEQAGVPL